MMIPSSPAFLHHVAEETISITFVSYKVDFGHIVNASQVFLLSRQTPDQRHELKISVNIMSEYSLKCLPRTTTTKIRSDVMSPLI